VLLQNNVYVAGYFFGLTQLLFGVSTFPIPGVNEMFFVKYDTAGNVIWDKSASGVRNSAG